MTFKLLKLVMLIVVCLVVAVNRFLVPTHGLNTDDVYKDFAHLFVGLLFGAALATMRDWFRWPEGDWEGLIYIVLASGLTATEVIAFFVRG